MQGVFNLSGLSLNSTGVEVSIWGTHFYVIII